MVTETLFLSETPSRRAAARASHRPTAAWPAKRRRAATKSSGGEGGPLLLLPAWGIAPGRPGVGTAGASAPALRSPRPARLRKERRPGERTGPETLVALSAPSRSPRPGLWLRADSRCGDRAWVSTRDTATVIQEEEKNSDRNNGTRTVQHS